MRKIKRIRKAFGPDKPEDAYDNLLGAYIDLRDTKKVDKASLNTISRVLGQLSTIRDVIDDEK